MATRETDSAAARDAPSNIEERKFSGLVHSNKKVQTKKRIVKIAFIAIIYAQKSVKMNAFSPFALSKTVYFSSKKRYNVDIMDEYAP